MTGSRSPGAHSSSSCSSLPPGGRRSRRRSWATGPTTSSTPRSSRTRSSGRADGRCRPRTAARRCSSSEWTRRSDETCSSTSVRARTSLEVTVFATCFSMGLGVLLGALAWYFRGTIDTVVSRLSEVVMAFPLLPLRHRGLGDHGRTAERRYFWLSRPGCSSRARVLPLPAGTTCGSYAGRCSPSAGRSSSGRPG